MLMNNQGWYTDRLVNNLERNSSEAYSNHAVGASVGNGLQRFQRIVNNTTKNRFGELSMKFCKF